MYLAECAPSHVRGRIVSTNIAMVAFGQFIANVVDWIFSPDKLNGWRYVYYNQVLTLTRCGFFFLILFCL